MPSIWLRSAPPVIRCRGARNSTRGSFLLGSGPGFGRRQRLCGRLAGLRQLAQLGLNGLVAVGDLPQIELEPLKVLAQREQVFGPVVAGQSGDYLLLAGFAITVAMRRQLVRVAYP